jgi:O-antigen ligase
MNFVENKKNILIAALLGTLVALLIMKAMPKISENTFFIIGIPLVCVFLLAAVINIKHLLVILFFTRALLDPILEFTKINVMGTEVGIGGGLNLIIIVFAVILFIQQPERVLKTKFIRFWAVFLFICLASMLYSPYLGSALKILLNLVTYMCIALLPFIVVKNKNDRDFWLKVILFSAILPALLAFADLATGGTQYSAAGTGMRIQGTFTHPNILAFYLVLIIAVVFYFLKSKSFKLSIFSTTLLWGYLLLLFLLLLATKTRSAWIACWSFFFLYGILHERKYIFYSLILPPFLLLSPDVRGRVGELLGSKGASVADPLSSFAWRRRLWESTFPLIAKRPLFGYGLASFRKMSHLFFEMAQKSGVDAHNTYLEFFFETGLVGMFSYLSLFLYPLVRFFKKVREKAASSGAYSIVAAYLVSYMIVNASDNMFYYLAFNWYFWFLLGLMLRSLDFKDE